MLLYSNVQKLNFNDVLEFKWFPAVFETGKIDFDIVTSAALTIYSLTAHRYSERNTQN